MRQNILNGHLNGILHNMTVSLKTLHSFIKLACEELLYQIERLESTNEV